MTSQRSIVCIVPDIFFLVKIENLARRHDIVVNNPRDLDSFKEALGKASLALIDTGSQELPWADWLVAAKSDPQTRDTPILAFGSHVDLETRDLALDSGADRFLARSNFVEGLHEIIARAARELSDEPCSEALPEGALRGIEEFNQGKYFEQHETLELVWRAETRPVRELYRGILQIGVAFLQIERGNAVGAEKMFKRGFRWLKPFHPACQGVDVERLVRESKEIYDEVLHLGAERIVELDQSKLPKVWFLDV